MSLKILMGGSGQGKTRRVLKEAIAYSKDNPKKNCYIIVPEQFSLEMQRKLVEIHPDHGYFNIDVLSFYRLAYRVFDECGFQPKDILEDLGVSLLLKKILTEHEEEFPFFKKTIRKMGFVDELKSMLMEFICYGVGWEQLEALDGSLEEHPVLASKCRELGEMFRYLEQEMSDRFMVAEQIPDVFCSLISQSGMLRDSVCFFDGFTGFTPIQLQCIRELLKVTEKVWITVTMEGRGTGFLRKKGKAEEDLFYFSEKTVDALMKICREAGVTAEEEEICHSLPPRFQNEELAFLEKHLFRPYRESYDKEVHHLHLSICRNPSMEAEYVLHKIEALVRRKGYRYRDFAVLAGNVEEYGSAFRRQAQILHMPLFEDTKRKVSYHSGVESIRALFHLAAMDYSYESVFRYLKSGMSDFSDEEIDVLENYVIGAGIRGYSMWKKPFTRRMQKMEENQAEILQQLREKLMGETEEVVLALRRKDGTVREKMTALYGQMCRLHYHEKLQALADEAEKRGDFVREKEYRQLFSLLVDLLDKLVGIFGKEAFSVEELAEIMDAGLDALGLGTAPLSGDQVILGDLKRTRLPDNKILFFVGMNEGKIPPVREEKGIIHDEEKKVLQELGISLSMPLSEQSLEDEFYMYLACSRPEEALYFTFSMQDNDGTALRPSSLLRKCGRLFPKWKERSYPGEEIRYYFNVEDSREYLMKELRRRKEGEPSTEVFRQLFQYWKEEDGRGEKLLHMWRQINGTAGKKRLPAEMMQEMFGKEIRGSVTRMELYAACPYQYYCMYGLELKEREEYRVRAVDLGNLFHEALEKFSKKVKSSEYSWKTIPEKVADEWVREALGISVEKGIQEVLQSTARNRYKLKIVERILRRTIRVLQIHLKNSQMEPDRFELHFGGVGKDRTVEFPLSRGNRMILEGFIDRVDIYEEEDKLYLRVIDYKSGAKTFDLSDLYYGLQMQLIVYLNVASEIYKREKKKEVIPAGMFYYHVKDPIINMEEEDAENQIKNFRMSGYANSEPEVLEKLEQNQSNFVSAQVRLTKAGVPYKNSRTMGTEDFYEAGEYMKRKMVKMGEELYDGNIEASPYKSEKRTACDYCPYAGVCGFDVRLEGFSYRDFAHMSPEDVLNEIQKEEEGE